MKILALACVGLIVGCADPYNVVGAADASPLAEPTDPADRRVETGQVNWLRNLDEAKQLAAKTDKPLFVLFQEIPG